MDKRQIAAHEQTLTIRVPQWVPGHEERGHDMQDFEKNRQQLIDDGYGYCWGCAIAGLQLTEDLQCHHFAVEWAEWDDTDPVAALHIMKTEDPYGYAAKMGDEPVTSPNDIRNLLFLCQPCHTGAPEDPAKVVEQPSGYISGGVHYSSKPVWNADRIRVRKANQQKEGS